ncbi:hypothetical protein Ct61P_02328 [Colletotrichum tofieldiae]|nr:hypothetical protein Ct61P_02328 [Colletotrichum tofieldiae]
MSRAQSRISPPPPVHHRDYGADWVQDEEAALARPRDLDGAGQDLVTSSEVREQRILQVLPSATEQNPFLQLGFRNRIASNFLSSSDDVKDRRDRVESTLEPLFDVAPFVLMCTGESDNAVIMPVALGENADPVDQWTAIQRAAWKCRSRWRSLVGPARLELVKIRVVGQHHSRRDTFRGSSSLWTSRPAYRCFEKMQVCLGFTLQNPQEISKGFNPIATTTQAVTTSFIQTGASMIIIRCRMSSLSLAM